MSRIITQLTISTQLLMDLMKINSPYSEILGLGSLYLPTLLTNSAKVFPAEIVNKLHTITKSNSNFRVQKKPANGFHSKVGESGSYRQDPLRCILILFPYTLLAILSYSFSSCLPVKMFYNLLVAAAMLHVLLIPSSLISSH